MFRYTAQRLTLLVITLFMIISVHFCTTFQCPGSFITHTDPKMPKRCKKAIEDKYHLNDPMIVQYGYFLKDFSRLDFGLSIGIQPKVPVNQILATKVPVSMQLNIFSLLLSFAHCYCVWNLGSS